MAAYDYVIVGAGSAGCVLAARLTEDPDVSVLLVEAGPTDVKENIHVPAAFGSLFKTDVDWDYSTAPEDGCNGRMMFLPRGKVLGGSSSINAMVYIRGAREDYDGWRDAGNAGWGYDDMLPYFRRSEDNERGESEYHGVGGPLTEREVILSSGAYNTPQLLMLSGVGPAEHLTTREIEVAVDLPGVGQNLQDHINSGVIYTTDEPVSLLLGMEPQHQQEFAEQGRGPLTSNVAEAGGFFRTRDDLAAPDLQYHVAPVMFVDEGLGDPVAHGISFGACLLTPRSRGSVTLRSNDPSAKPWIRHNFLAEEDDVRVMLDGLRLTMDIARAPALSRYCRDRFVAPGSSDDGELRAHLGRRSQTLYHPVGTCAMGSGPEAVVDSDLRVYGVEALRVVD